MQTIWNVKGLEISPTICKELAGACSTFEVYLAGVYLGTGQQQVESEVTKGPKGSQAVNGRVVA